MTASPEETVRVSTLELFFDLVFVFTITQLTSVLAHAPNGTGVLQVVLMLVAIWWMYDAYAWLTNAMPPTSRGRRLFLLSGMACFFVVSLAIPRCFSGDGTAFAVAYLGVIALHTGMYVGAAAWPTLRAVLGFARFNLAAAVLILVASFLPGRWEYAPWVVAVALITVTPWLITDVGDRINASHFVERHGLVVIVALGESVVAVGIGASGQPITASMVAVAVLGLALSACLWWTYFGGDEEDAERALAETPVERRAWRALMGFYYTHLLVLFGIVAVAAAIERAIGHAGDPLGVGRALFLGGGAAAFFAGDILFCRALGIEHSRWRLLAVPIALATTPLGTEVSALLQLTVLACGLIVCVTVDRSVVREPARADAALG